MAQDVAHFSAQRKINAFPVCLVVLTAFALQIADALFANKTFAEIFAGLQTQSLQDQVDEILSNDVQQGGSLTGSEVAVSLAEAGLTEIRPTLERIVEIFRQVIQSQVH